MAKHCIRGVLTGEELNVCGTDSKRAKSHRKGEPRRDSGRDLYLDPLWEEFDRAVGNYNA